MDMVNTPLRVFKEARRKGDTAIMERAMGYVNEFEGKAEQYKTEADAGMKEETKEAMEKAKSELEKATLKRREECEKFEERIEENRETREDKVEISEDGKVLLEKNTKLDNIDLDNTVSPGTAMDAADIVMELVTYTKTGDVNHTKQNERSTSMDIGLIQVTEYERL